MQRRLALALMLLATEAMYLPLSVLRGPSTLFGWDYMMLHARRLAFARDALFSGHRLPGWYPREMLGTPFSANLQNFPWIPTHWRCCSSIPTKPTPLESRSQRACLLCSRSVLQARGIVPDRRRRCWLDLRLRGPFASSVMVGHLVNLEGYPALPLLLWLADRATVLAPGAATCRTRHRNSLRGCRRASAASGLRSRDRFALRLVAVDRPKLAAAIALGIGATMAAWWPMLLLIRRSSRALPLDPAANDIVMPYHRLLGLVAPGIDGWPAGVGPSAQHLFSGYSPYFWDTFAYVGLLPLVAAAVLVSICIVRHRLPATRWLFLAIVGIIALLAALPLLDPLRHAIPITLLRSPARLLYLCTFSLAASLGVATDYVLRSYVRAWAGRSLLPASRFTPGISAMFRTCLLLPVRSNRSTCQSFRANSETAASRSAEFWI